MSQLNVNVVNAATEVRSPSYKDEGGAAVGVFKHMLPTMQSAVRTGTGDFINYAAAIGNPAASNFSSLFDAATGIYTVPETGYYQVFGMLATDAAARSIANLYKNGSSICELVDHDCQHGNIGNTAVVRLTVGDQIKLSCVFTAGGNIYTWFSVMWMHP